MEVEAWPLPVGDEALGLRLASDGETRGMAGSPSKPNGDATACKDATAARQGGSLRLWLEDGCGRMSRVAVASWSRGQIDICWRGFHAQTE